MRSISLATWTCLGKVCIEGVRIELREPGARTYVKNRTKSEIIRILEFWL